jgi:hydrogenase maturation protease
VSEPVSGTATPSSALAEARARSAASHPVRVIVLGEIHRGDDGVAFIAVRAAVAALTPAVMSRVEIRETGQLDPADLVELPARGSAVVVDAVVGVPIGKVVVLSLEDVARGGDPGSAPRPRSSHVLPVDQLVALAAALRGSPPHGVLVGVGCERFGLGEGLSPAVEAAVPALAATIRAEVERLIAEAS